jgi:hypothetical protein
MEAVRFFEALVASYHTIRGQIWRPLYETVACTRARAVAADSIRTLEKFAHTRRSLHELQRPPFLFRITALAFERYSLTEVGLVENHFCCFAGETAAVSSAGSYVKNAVTVRVTLWKNFFTQVSQYANCVKLYRAVSHTRKYPELRYASLVIPFLFLGIQFLLLKLSWIFCESVQVFV